MELVNILILILFVISAIILILVILLQDVQGEGIGGMFGGGSSTAFGSRSGNVLTRFTSIVGAIFLFGAFGLAWLNRTPETSDVVRKARIERLREAEKDDWWVEKFEESDLPATWPDLETLPEIEEPGGPETILPSDEALSPEDSADSHGSIDREEVPDSSAEGPGGSEEAEDTASSEQE